jgi:hypothetical protein
MPNHRSSTNMMLIIQHPHAGHIRETMLSRSQTWLRHE